MTEVPRSGAPAGRYYGTVLALTMVFIVAARAGQVRLSSLVGGLAIGIAVLTEFGLVMW